MVRIIERKETPPTGTMPRLAVLGPNAKLETALTETIAKAILGARAGLAIARTIQTRRATPHFAVRSETKCTATRVHSRRENYPRLTLDTLLNPSISQVRQGDMSRIAA